MWILLLAWVVTTRVYKKSAPNGRLTVYIGKRDFVDYVDHVDPIDGVIVVDSDYLKGRKVFGQVVTTFRYGREEDEVMGLKFSRDLYLIHDQLFPKINEKVFLSDVQEKLVKKLGVDSAIPFRFTLPDNAPVSVTLQPGQHDLGRPLGVEYEMKVYVADEIQDRPHRRNAVGLAIRKVQFAPVSPAILQPSTVVNKGFALSPGKVQLEVVLDKELYYHGDRVAASISITNQSKKSVRSIRVSVVQFCELLMVNAQYTKEVASVESKEGCPITPGANLNKVFFLTPIASSNKDKRGIALDGRLRDEDVNLASSTLMADGKTAADAVGIVVAYAVRVRLHLGALAGELVADLPFKLVHPAPGSKPALLRQKSQALQRQASKVVESSDEENFVFEDFAKLRMSMNEEDKP